MDLKIVGKFIQERRKEKKLTQVELAERIFVSEKTISKWECGKGFPDTSLILPLCKELGISANELLSGKVFQNEKEYKDVAEQNLLMLKSQQEKANKHLLTVEWVIGCLSVGFLLTMTIISSLFDIAEGWRIGLVVFGLVVCFVGVCFCLKIEVEAGYYECGCCHHKYIPTYKQVLWAMHIGRTRYLKCPNCHKKSWNKKTINMD